MKFGVMLNHEWDKEDDAQERIAQFLRVAEASRDFGYDSLFGIHHYLSSLATLQPLLFLARLIPVTGDMRLGVGVYIGSLEHPVHLAENVATLDQLSGGRVILGLGAGYRRNEFNAFGVDRTKRWLRMGESLDLLRLLWSGEEVDYRGEQFAVEGERISLVPAQRPGPPIWIGANDPKTIERAARIGCDTWLAPPNVKMKWAIGNLHLFQEKMAENNHDPAGREYPLIRELYVADTDAAAEREASEYIKKEYFQYADYGPEVAVWKTMFDDLREKAFLFGSPETIAEKLAEFAQAGFNHFIFRTSWGGMPTEMSLNTIARFAKEIAPRFEMAAA